MKKYYTSFYTSLCKMVIIGTEQEILRLHLNTDGGNRKLSIEADWYQDEYLFASAICQISEYIKGRRVAFDLKLNPHGTVFQKAVWKKLKEIPYGTLISYKEIAQSLGGAEKARAVGTAIGKNPIPLLIPCHRVVGADGRLAGFAHGIQMKERLIALEAGNIIV